MNEQWKGFVFVDVNDNLLDEPHDLGHGLILRKATLEEIKDRQVDIVFRMWSERRGFLNQRRQSPEDNSKPSSGSILPNPEEWRHAVIASSKNKIFFWDVNLAFSISNADLRIGLIHFENNSYSTPYPEFTMLNIRSPLGAIFVDHKLPSLDDLPELKQNLDYVLLNIQNNFPSEIREVIHIFSTLDNLADSSLFKTLGYFAVIEGLLSHPPQPSDRMDSIQKQLIRNINLLNNRLKKINREISWNDFGSTKLDKVLKKLYEYRSAIAHGGKVNTIITDISKMRPGNIKTDHLWIHDWLRALTKKLILAAIVESELVKDLK